MKLKFLLLLFCSGLFNQLFAQTESELFSMGLGLGGTTYLNNGRTTCFDLRAQITIEDGSEALFVIFKYQNPYQTNDKTTASAKDFNNPVDKINVPYQVDYSYYNGTVNYLYAITDTDLSDYYFYLFGGIGAGIMNNKYTIGNYNKNAYRIDYEEQFENRNLIAANMDLGVGVTYRLDRFKIFGETKGSILRIFNQTSFETDNLPLFAVNLQVGLAYIIAKY